ncbi:hypothetical protein BT96DRAFT_951186, partial [Gymnopus androsaceus JB14]
MFEIPYFTPEVAPTLEDLNIQDILWDFRKISARCQENKCQMPDPVPYLNQAMVTEAGLMTDFFREISAHKRPMIWLPYLASLVDKNNADIHCFKNEKASLEDQLTKQRDEMDCADVDQGLREVAQEKVLEEMVEIEKITSEVQVQLNASRQEKEATIQEKEAAILEKNQALNEKAAAIQENEKTIQDLAADHMKQIEELNRAKEAADTELRTRESAQTSHNKTELAKQLQEKEAALQAKHAALREMTEARLHAEREKADFETEMASLRDWLRERLPKGKTPQSKPTVDEDVDMDADDESSGSSPSSKANVGDIPALVKQVVTEVLAEQAKGNHPDNPSQNRKVKNRHSLKPGSTAYNRK